MRNSSLPIVITVLMLVYCCRAAAQGNQTVTNGETTNAVSFPATGCVYNWVNNQPGIGLPASGTGNIASFKAINTGNSPVTATIIATPVAVGYAYITNFGSNSVSVINTATNTINTTIPLTTSPGGVSATPDGTRVYVANENTNNVSVIDTKTNTVITTIAVGTDPVALAVSPDGSKVYVTNSGDGTVSVISTSSNKVTGLIKGFIQPYFAAPGPVNNLLYVANSPLGTVSVVNTSTNAIIKTITVGNDPIQLAVTPDGSKVYATNELSNTVSVINATTNSLTMNIPVGSRPYAEAISPDGNFVYVCCAGDGTVMVIDTKTNQIIKVINLGAVPSGISFTADGSEVYVANDNSFGVVFAISTATNSIIATIPVGTYPYAIGNFTIPGTPCTGTTVTFTITVNPTPANTPTIVAGPVSGGINTCAGAPSSSPELQQFTVYGSALSSDLTVSAPANFEISLSETNGYGSSLTLTPVAGTVNSTLVYVRSAASAPPGHLSELVQLTSPGAISQNLAVSATVNALPVVTAPADQKLPAGTLTQSISFSGTGNTYNWVNDTPGIGLAASGTGDIASFTAVNKGTSPITATITVTPVLLARAYVANYYGDNVSVIDLATNTVIATIGVGGNPDGVSVSPDGTRAYISNEFDHTVSAINTATNTVIATFPTATDPAGLMVTPDGKRLYVATGVSNVVSVIDIASGKNIMDITVGEQPYGVAITPDGQNVYVCNFKSNTVSVIPTSGSGVSATIPVGSQPVGLAVSPDGSTVYVANQGDGSVSVISTSSNTVTTTFSEGTGATGVAVSPDGSQLYVTNTGAAAVSIINTANNVKTTSVNVGQHPYGVSVNGDGSILYVVNNVSNSVSAISTLTNTVVATIPIDRDPYSLGNFINTGAGCAGTPVKFTITIDPEAPSGITATGTPSPLTTVYGTPSSSTFFSVSGNGLNAGILVTPPTGFEVSSDDITFTPTVTIGTGGAIPATQVYIRLEAKTPVGNDYSGNIILSSSGTTSVDVTMPVSVVTPAPLTITANDKSKVSGAPNPVLTASYNGFVNDESPAVLTSLPLLATTAMITSPPGQYPITASGAASPNYSITYIPGILTVIGNIVIPNTFTPNGDGVNDTWNIKYLNAYSNCSVDIFSRYGQKVYSSTGYAIPWDGTIRGAALPTGTYYYIINLKNGGSPLSGFVAIVR